MIVQDHTAGSDANLSVSLDVSDQRLRFFVWSCEIMYDIELRSDMNVQASMTDFNIWFFDLGIQIPFPLENVLSLFTTYVSSSS
jgi:hypothetical protein